MKTTLNEFLRVATHPRVFPEPLSLGEARSWIHDLHTAALMREHGIPEIHTADVDSHQFPFLRAINPLVP
jgi:predicted nucleic acid-binding protein